MFGDAYPVRPSAGLSSLSTVPDGGNVVKASVTKLPKRRVSREADKENDEGLGEDVVDVPHCVEISSLEYHPSKVFAHLKIAGDSRVLQVRNVLLFVTFNPCHPIGCSFSSPDIT